MKRKKKLNQTFVFLGLLCLIGILPPFFAGNQYMMTLFVQVLINLIVVLGLNFITGLTGQMNLGTAGIYAFGAYTSGLLTTRFGISPWLTIPLAGLMGSIIGICLGYPSLRMKGAYLSLTTIAFTEVTRLLITNLPDVTGGTQGVRHVPPLHFFGYQMSATTNNLAYFYFMLAMVVVIGLIALRLVNGKWGREFKAVRDNIEAVESCGLNVAEIKIKAFTLCAIFGALAGSFYAHFMGYLNPISFTVDMSIMYVIMLMVGGIGNVIGNVIGAAVVTMLPEMLRFLGDYYQITYSIIILCGAIFLPGGLMSLIQKALRAANKQGKEAAEHGADS